MSEPIVLGIESTCDETAAAVVQGRTLISNVVASSMDEHARYGGVIPEIASRAHAEAFVPCVSKALADANMTLSDVDAIGRIRGTRPRRLSRGRRVRREIVGMGREQADLRHQPRHRTYRGDAAAVRTVPQGHACVDCVGRAHFAAACRRRGAAYRRGRHHARRRCRRMLRQGGTSAWFPVSRRPAHRPSRTAGQPTCHQSASGPYTRQGGAAASVRFQFLRREDGRGALDRTAAGGRQ